MPILLAAYIISDMAFKFVLRIDGLSFTNEKRLLQPVFILINAMYYLLISFWEINDDDKALFVLFPLIIITLILIIFQNKEIIISKNFIYIKGIFVCKDSVKKIETNGIVKICIGEKSFSMKNISKVMEYL
jgi:hypothetical protein